MQPIEDTNLYRSIYDYCCDYMSADQIFTIACAAFDEGLAAWDETIDDIDPDEFQQFIQRY